MDILDLLILKVLHYEEVVIETYLAKVCTADLLLQRRGRFRVEVGRGH